MLIGVFCSSGRSVVCAMSSIPDSVEIDVHGIHDTLDPTTGRCIALFLAEIFLTNRRMARRHFVMSAEFVDSNVSRRQHVKVDRIQSLGIDAQGEVRQLDLDELDIPTWLGYAPGETFVAELT